MAYLCDILINFSTVSECWLQMIIKLNFQSLLFVGAIRHSVPLFVPGVGNNHPLAAVTGIHLVSVLMNSADYITL